MNVKILRFTDRYIFGLFILVFFWLKYLFVYKKNYIVQHPKKILVVRLWALGSSLLTFPMIKQLQNHYGKDVQYDLLATSRNIGVFKNQGYFHQIYNLFSLKGALKMIFSFKKYDIVIDAEEYFHISSVISFRAGKISVGYGNLMIRKLAYTFSYHYSEKQHNLINCLSLLTPLGNHIHAPETMEPLKYEHKNTIKVDEFMQKFIGKKIICLHAGGAETSPDRFRSNDNWISLIEHISKIYGDSVVIFLSGTEFEKKGIQEIMKKISHDAKQHVVSLCGVFNLFEFAYLLTKCNLMISNDTGPMHLAAAMGTKTIGLFGPNLPQIFGPWPLSKNVCLYTGNGKIYTKPHLGIFMKDRENNIDKIKVEDVLENIQI